MSARDGFGGSSYLRGEGVILASRLIKLGKFSECSPLTIKTVKIFNMHMQTIRTKEVTAIREASHSNVTPPQWQHVSFLYLRKYGHSFVSRFSYNVVGVFRCSISIVFHLWKIEGRIYLYLIKLGCYLKGGAYTFWVTNHWHLPSVTSIRHAPSPLTVTFKPLCRTHLNNEYNW